MHAALSIKNSSTATVCRPLTTYCPVSGPVPTSPANNDYKPGFAPPSC